MTTNATRKEALLLNFKVDTVTTVSRATLRRIAKALGFSGRAHRATDPKAGLDRDTKFDLGNTVRLPFDTEWFAPPLNRRFGDHPKRGILNLKDEKLKRALQAAILEAKEAGRL